VTTDPSGWTDRGRGPDRARLAALALAALAAVVAVVAATELFPHRSLNHDEGVYLQQAELLLAGRLRLRPPVPAAFRPWFFVDGPRGLYPKYGPLPAAVFALGRALGGYVLGLAAVAAALVGATAALGRELFDRRVGPLAAALVLASPLFLVHAGLYLPYAVTAALDVGFAAAYLRAERRERTTDAALAGLAVGLAFFARPYTAVAFALPFVGHALATLVRARVWRVVRGGADAATRGLLRRRLVTATLGTAGVAATLGYNALVTGDPLTFPYLAFAPEDGVGFGERAILGHGVEYTPGLALEANAVVVRTLFTEWVIAGTVGTAAAAVGVAVGLARGPRADRWRRAVLAATVPAVVGANVAFWGNYNVLGDLDAAGDGLIAYLGPYYHYDLLVPTAVFAAAACVAGADRLRPAVEGWVRRHTGGDDGRARAVGLAVVLAVAAAGGGVAADAAADPLARNAAVSDELDAGYEPLTAPGGDRLAPPTDAVVFLPTPYGPWLNHPFQRLRNPPDYEGSTVYALGDTDELAVAGAFPERDLHRYVHAGAWNPTDGEPVRADVVPVRRIAGERVVVTATLDRPAGARETTVRATTDAGSGYLVADGDEPLRLTATVADGRVTVAGPTGDPATVAVGDRDEVVLEAFVATGPASGFSYRVVFPVARDGDGLRALSPTVRRCPVPTRCLPVWLADEPSATVTVGNGTGERSRVGG
jgi:hypothetical protein